VKDDPPGGGPLEGREGLPEELPPSPGRGASIPPPLTPPPPLPLPLPPPPAK
jgi:hypothetical protein